MDRLMLTYGHSLKILIVIAVRMFGVKFFLIVVKCVARGVARNLFRRGTKLGDWG